MRTLGAWEEQRREEEVQEFLKNVKVLLVEFVGGDPYRGM